MIRFVLAWTVHFYTALGLACAAGMVYFILEGDSWSIRQAFLLMIVATLIDATDGTMARAIRIKEVLPGFDGRKLDDVVDYLTYVAVPLFLLWRTNVLPSGGEWVLLLPLFAAAYGFCQVEAKTDDGYFLGFPSYWNVVAFYLVFLELPDWANLSLLVTLSLLTFVPLRYLYPTMKGRFNLLTNLLAVPWTLLLLGALLNNSNGISRLCALASLFFPLWYFGVSAWVNFLAAQRYLRLPRPKHPKPTGDSLRQDVI